MGMNAEDAMAAKGYTPKAEAPVAPATETTKAEAPETEKAETPAESVETPKEE